MTTPESAGFEPDVNLMCDDLFGGFHCTRTVDHDGDHVAHGLDFPRMDRMRVIRSWPQLRLSDVLDGPGFPDLGPRSERTDAVLADAVERLRELATWESSATREQAKARMRAAKEITAAHADPDWPGEF